MIELSKFKKYNKSDETSDAEDSIDEKMLENLELQETDPTN